MQEGIMFEIGVNAGLDESGHVLSARGVLAPLLFPNGVLAPLLLPAIESLLLYCLLRVPEFDPSSVLFDFRRL